jgi:site-specific recombinase XerD
VSQAFRGIYAARDRALFLLGVKTGYRISELLSLRVGDVWQQGSIARSVLARPSISCGKPTLRAVS